MITILYPKEYTDSIYKIDYKALLKSGKTALVFDIDNTLAPFDVPAPDSKLIKHLKGLEKKGFKICLLSNNKQERVTIFNKGLGFCAVHKAGKPKLKGVKQALSLLEATPQNTALIGDQIFTDVFCGNRLRMYTILVKPIANRDEFTVKLKRGFEKIVIKAYLKAVQKNG